MNLQEHYEIACERVSDINEHVPTLREYASKCDHVTEMGVRSVVSTYGIMMGKPKVMKSYDVIPVESFGVPRTYLTELAKENGVDFEFTAADVLQIEIEETDMLFIDTLHTYNQLKQELALHAGKVKKYLAFHDTTTYGEIAEGGQGVGLWPAIEEFLQDNPNWVVERKDTNNNGFTVLRRES